MSSRADTDGFVERVAYEAMRDKRDALLAEIQRYEEALEEIAYDPDSLLLKAKQIARRALAGDAE